MSFTDESGFAESETHRMMRETAREVASGYGDDYWRDVSDGMEPTEFWQDCADAGFLGVTVPEEYGGEGMGISELTTIVEELVAHGSMGAEMLFVVNVVFGAVTLTNHGSETQKEELLEPLVNGDLNFCMALTEPNAGHNAPNLDTFAEEQDDGTFLIDGSKQWISGVDTADEMLLVARTTPKDEVAKRTQGITLFLADPQDENIERRELDVGIPTPENQYELSFDGYEATEDDIIGTRDMGLYQLFDTVNPERLVGAAGAIGVGRNAIERAVEYANDRVVFDEPIGAHQAIQHPLADAYSKVEAAKLLVQKASWLMDETEGTEDMKKTAEVSNMAKLRASEAGHEATDVALQTHGGNGFSRDYMIVEMWKGSRLGTVAPGSSQMMRNHIAEHTLGLPRSY
ncbi:acyl-CoA dehydrogenase family protein [Halorientalis regularis]|jgi:acyl-CoA dehydrogenase|uniref:Acyl-CoA dehydrogenase n=1 Tax=Halorientalis regularis TaxID=660518 RepID=A0A1G7KRR8_9EURY|nr:acyl-CoA dehydrogenase family protein [Halorientalis regularis]SDF39903.1 acyl-CoA dehydrogenase [Halorientalis regularis]